MVSLQINDGPHFDTKNIIYAYSIVEISLKNYIFCTYSTILMTSQLLTTTLMTLLTTRLIKSGRTKDVFQFK